MFAADLDLALTATGLAAGLLVGLTGMGGGVLLTPVLILFFGIDPLTAVSSDLVVSLVMKPVGGAVHWRRGTVRTDIVRWLMLGSVPTAFAGAVILDQLGPNVDGVLRKALGAVLLVSAAAMIVRRALAARQPPDTVRPATLRPLPTLALGAVGGLMVGLTSVGSGSIVIVVLLMLYPTLKSAEIVGTDLVQAVPLVASAALGHVLFGSVQVTLTLALLLGALPGVYIGARLSSRSAERFIRPALFTVLIASGFKLLQVI